MDNPGLQSGDSGHPTPASPGGTFCALTMGFSPSSSILLQQTMPPECATRVKTRAASQKVPPGLVV